MQVHMRLLFLRHLSFFYAGGTITRHILHTFNRVRIHTVVGGVASNIIMFIAVKSVVGALKVCHELV